MFIGFIDPGWPEQKPFIEHLTRSLHNESLNLYLLRRLSQVRQLAGQSALNTTNSVPMAHQVDYCRVDILGKVGKYFNFRTAKLTGMLTQVA